MNFHDELKLTMHKYVKYIYKLTRTFPKDELYGVVSQIRRSALSVILNYIEGFARRKGNDSKIYINFLETAYGSLKESKYLLFFSLEENYITNEDYTTGLSLADKIGKMLWGLIKN